MDAASSVSGKCEVPIAVTAAVSTRHHEPLVGLSHNVVALHTNIIQLVVQ